MATGIHHTHAYRQARRAMFAYYGDVCHICGHAGAGEADHLTPASLAPDQKPDPHMMRPAHGWKSPCPICVGANGKPRRCNQERQAKPVGYAFRPAQEW